MRHRRVRLEGRLGRGDPQRPRQALPDYLDAYLRPGGRLYQRSHFAPAAPGARFQYSNVGSALAAQVPLAQMFGYIGQLRALSAGRAQFTMQLSHHAEVPARLALAA